MKGHTMEPIEFPGRPPELDIAGLTAYTLAAGSQDFNLTLERLLTSELAIVCRRYVRWMDDPTTVPEGDRILMDLILLSRRVDELLLGTQGKENG